VAALNAANLALLYRSEDRITFDTAVAALGGLASVFRAMPDEETGPPSDSVAATESRRFPVPVPSNDYARNKI